MANEKQAEISDEIENGICKHFIRMKICENHDFMIIDYGA